MQSVFAKNNDLTSNVKICTKKCCRRVLVIAQRCLYIVFCPSVSFSPLSLLDVLKLKCFCTSDLRLAGASKTLANLATQFSLTTCSVRCFRSATRSVWVSGVHWLVAVVPTSLHSALPQLNQNTKNRKFSSKDLSFETVVWQHRDPCHRNTTKLAILCHPFSPLFFIKMGKCGGTWLP